MRVRRMLSMRAAWWRVVAQDFPKLTSSMTKQIDAVLNVDIPNLVKMFDNPFP